jgi:hypothetical protein
VRGVGLGLGSGDGLVDLVNRADEQPEQDRDDRDRHQELIPRESNSAGHERPPSEG